LSGNQKLKQKQKLPFSIKEMVVRYRSRFLVKCSFYQVRLSAYSPAGCVLAIPAYKGFILFRVRPQKIGHILRWDLDLWLIWNLVSKRFLAVGSRHEKHFPQVFGTDLNMWRLSKKLKA